MQPQTWESMGTGAGAMPPPAMPPPAMPPPPPPPPAIPPASRTRSGSTQSAAPPQTCEERIIDLLRACRGSRKLVLLIVAVALLLDNMLLTSVGKEDTSRAALHNSP